MLRFRFEILSTEYAKICSQVRVRLCWLRARAHRVSRRGCRRQGELTPVLGRGLGFPRDGGPVRGHARRARPEGTPLGLHRHRFLPQYRRASREIASVSRIPSFLFDGALRLALHFPNPWYRLLNHFIRRHTSDEPKIQNSKYFGYLYFLIYFLI